LQSSIYQNELYGPRERCGDEPMDDESPSIANPPVVSLGRGSLSPLKSHGTGYINWAASLEIQQLSSDTRIATEIQHGFPQLHCPHYRCVWRRRPGFCLLASPRLKPCVDMTSRLKLRNKFLEVDSLFPRSQTTLASARAPAWVRALARMRQPLPVVIAPVVVAA
jgi:hypothetical protein